MKFIFILFMFSVATPSFAYIDGPELSPRHQAVIVKAIEENCSLSGKLTEVLTDVRLDRVDHGVIDYYYTSQFTLINRIDQGVFDTYKVIVESALFSAYVHDAQDWGVINVQSVECILL